jgi:hypothetical protein
MFLLMLGLFGGVMSELAKFLILSNPLELRSDHFSSGLHRPGGINDDITVCLDGA